jgi:hypothetical protein
LLACLFLGGRRNCGTGFSGGEDQPKKEKFFSLALLKQMIARRNQHRRKVFYMIDAFNILFPGAVTSRMRAGA